MAWTVPTVAEVRAAIPALADVDGAVFDMAVALAVTEVPKSLPTQAVYARAYSFYVAHELTLDGHGSSPEAAMAATGSLQSVSDGAVSFSRKTDNDGPLSLTTYGIRFTALLKKYTVPFIVSGTTETPPYGSRGEMF